MAVVRMKKVFLVGPLEHREDAVIELEKLNVLHVVDLADEFREPPAELASEHARAKRIVEHLGKLRAGLEKPPKVREGDITEMIALYDRLMSEKSAADLELSTLDKDRAQLLPWGDFSPADATLLEGRGIHLRFYSCSEKELKESGSDFLDDAFWHEFTVLKGAKNIGISAMFKGEIPEVPYDTLILPERSLSILERRQKQFEERLAEIHSKLEGLTAYLPVFEAYHVTCLSRYDRARVVGGIKEEGPFFALMGWIPSNRVGGVERAMKNLPVVVLAEDPEYGEDVPIKFKNNAVVSWFEPLIAMFRLPTYWEPDPTIFVAPFMALFFGFCFGDAAYGLVLLGLATWGAGKLKSNRTGLGFMRMLQVLGISTFIMGGLMGSFFGLQFTNFGWAQSIRGLMPIASFTKNEGYNDFLVFAIRLGIIQVIVGQLIGASIAASRREVQKVICFIGWICASVVMHLLINVMFGLSSGDTLVSTPFLVLGGVSAGLILLFSEPSPNPAKRIGLGLWALYGVSGLGGDILSYARIFGLGLASGIIAATVNSMAYGVGSGMPKWIGWLPMAAILIFGHTFNLAMAVIGSLVHSARLNFLEFYGKFFEGGGKPYVPFGKQKIN
ncbi:hypothetical protein KKF84_06640 [Myxococcota bacterium]|nr:hypothetical protein [Myxococcota bacterium]